MWKQIIGNECLSEEKLKLNNEKPSTERICGLKLTPCRTLSHAIWRRMPWSLDSPICTMWEYVHPWPSKDGKNMSQKYLSCWNLQVVCAQLVFRNKEPPKPASGGGLAVPNTITFHKTWPKLCQLQRNIQLSCPRKQCQKPFVREEMTQICITSKETELYPFLESTSKNECFGKECPKWVLLRRRQLQLQPAKLASQTPKHSQTCPEK